MRNLIKCGRIFAVLPVHHRGSIREAGKEVIVIHLHSSGGVELTSEEQNTLHYIGRYLQLLSKFISNN